MWDNGGWSCGWDSCGRKLGWVGNFRIGCIVGMVLRLREVCELGGKKITDGSRLCGR